MDKPTCFNWGDGECRWVYTLAPEGDPAA